MNPDLPSNADRMKPIAMPFKLRRATDADAVAIAELNFTSYRLLTFLPMLHSIESCRRFVANVMLKECAVMVAEDDTGIVSFLALRGEEIRPRAMLLSSQYSRTALLRGPRLSRHPLHGRYGQRGTDP
jgi:hypothetical protein